jgi:DNA-binding GntR family transcriptional regulator
MTGIDETLEEQAYQRLLAAIQTGELVPGTRLVGTHLARRLQVSRITVANALKRLASEGYLESRPHRGSIVATLNEDDLREIFLIRHALEDIVLAETASVATAALIARLRDLDQAIRTAIERNDSIAYRDQERAFHILLYSAAQMRLVGSTLTDLWNRLEPYRNRRHAEMDLERDSAGDRVRIIDALERRDGSVAALEMRRHVDRGYERILFTLRAQPPDHPARSPHRRARDTFDAPNGSLVAAFGDVIDPRRSQGKLYRQERLLALIALALVAGARSRTQVAHWIAGLDPAVRLALGSPPESSPSMPTVHRAMRSAGIETPFRNWLLGHGYDVATSLTLVELAAAARTQCQATGWERFASLALHGTETTSPEARQLASDLQGVS